jgi:hypothetical protein
VIIQVTKMPPDLASWLHERNHCMPTYCYHNCFRAVFTNLFDTSQSIFNKYILRRRAVAIYPLQYVLGWVTHKSDGIKTPHALLKVGSNYHDPTVEPQGKLGDCTYELEKEFSSDELLSLLHAKFTKKQIISMKQGAIQWTPLRCTSPGVYEFTDE